MSASSNTPDRAASTALGGRPFAGRAARERRASLRMVDRVSADLRRGDPVLVRPQAGPALLIVAAETATAESLAVLKAHSGMDPDIILTCQRAAAIALCSDGGGVVRLSPGTLLDEDAARSLADPTLPLAPDLAGRLPSLPVARHAEDSPDGALAATRLAKIARLLPAVLAVDIERPLGAERLAATTDILSVSAFDIDHYAEHAAHALRRLTAARVPLEGAEHTEIVAFRPTDGGQEHLAIVIGGDRLAGAEDAGVLIRLHSECFTGDLLGSLRCDCGDQLRGAIAQIAEEGCGVVLYLAQEGRGIGLANKLRAYQLQDRDFDTVDANEMLGYADDERIYSPAAAMLRQLGIGRVRLMTNNPRKLDQLARHGIEVAARVPHAFPANGHNEFYLATKKSRSGHML